MRDVEQVSGELGLGSPAPGRPVQADKDLEGEFLGSSLTTELRGQVADQPGIVTMDEEAQCIVITTGDKAHEATVIVVEITFRLGHQR
jgi:hypothetical protein